MTDDDILNEMLADFPEDERDDPRLHDALRGTVHYQTRNLRRAAEAFGREFSEHVGTMLDRIGERRNEALRRWWNDPR